MITWMQRHKQYLMITIWVSTIAFVGAGFVGWGQYSYGDKAGAIAKVGEIEITQGELQKTYSNLYGQYNEMFQGEFDEEKAKQFGLQKQALNQLTQQALILNLAASYDLTVNDDEVLVELKTQKYFFNNGVFDKDLYKQALSRNNLTTKEYEDGLKKNLLIQKALKLLPVKTLESESKVINAVMNIADKLNYKILSQDDVQIDMSDESIKNFWTSRKQNFMSESTYELEYVKQAKIEEAYTSDEISAYYDENKNHFKGVDGKITPLEEAREKVVAELSQDATKKAALKTYIAYKKGNLDKDVSTQTQTISNSNNPYNEEVFQNISRLTVTLPYLKPVLVNDEYVIIQLLKTNAAQVKSYEDAKSEVLPLYVEETKKTKLIELANSSFAVFQGKTTDFVTTSDLDKFTDLSKDEAQDFLGKLFISKKKNSFIALNSGKLVLYNILEQKMLDNKNDNKGDTIAGLKSDIFNQGLIKELQLRYKTEIFLKGL